MHEIFNPADCYPIKLGSLDLSSLSWADDLILLSLSKDGLQSCLNKLEKYCKTWGLEINLKKTFCMVLSKGIKVCSPLMMNGTQLKFVKNVNYLGFNVSCNGNFQSIIKDRIAKATKVGHMVLQALSTNKNISTKLSMNIFDKQISPILMYGCAIWGTSKTHNLVYLEKYVKSGITRNIVASTLYDV